MDGPYLKIIHCFRSPVGGIFRHVRDLIDAQVAAGHAVGILCDSITGGAFEERQIAEIAPRLRLGVHRVTMRRSIAPSDLGDLYRTYRILGALAPDILHGHGAKGGAYARLVGTVLRRRGQPVGRLYTPHGGSMHYDPTTAGGRLYFAMERLLERSTDHLLFVSRYEEAAYHAKVGRPAVPARVVYNGLTDGEFVPVRADEDAADLLYLGMLRRLKGPDLLLEALGRLQGADGRPVTLAIVGAGEEKPALQAAAKTLMPGTVRFHDPMPAREAFRLGRMLVLPSRADSLPYVLLEALAADVPVTAVDVGGVGEIIPREIQPLVRPDDPLALAETLKTRLDTAWNVPQALRDHLRSQFAVSTMAGDTLAAYRWSLGSRIPAGAWFDPSANRRRKDAFPLGALRRRAADLARPKES